MTDATEIIMSTPSSNYAMHGAATSANDIESRLKHLEEQVEAQKKEIEYLKGQKAEENNQGEEADNPVLALNVGGTRFDVLRSTLTL